LIEEDASIIYEYLTKEIKISEENIFIFGRSLGSGPAIYLS
jgi:hypothetical protein